MDEEKVACFMATFGITEAEAHQMIADDEAIDHGANLFPLSAEQEKASKKARGTGTRTYTFTKRERKPDNDKRELVDLLMYALEFCETPHETSNITKTNPERQIDFVYNDRKFRIVLSAPRIPSK